MSRKLQDVMTARLSLEKAEQQEPTSPCKQEVEVSQDLLTKNENLACDSPAKVEESGIEESKKAASQD